MFEFAISAGEGTLVDFGVTNHPDDFVLSLDWDQTIVVAPCDHDCETGQ